MSESTGIPEGQRDTALFQIMSYWHKQNKSIDEAWECYADLHVQNKKDWIDFDSFSAKYVAVSAREETKQVDRISWAKENFIYVTATDEIYFAQDRIVRSLENLRKRHRETLAYGTKNDKEKSPKFAQLVDIWLDLPDRQEVDDIGFFPDERILYSFNGRSYVNTYVDRRPEAWHEAVGAKDEDLIEYMLVLSNMMENDERSVSLYLSSLHYKLTNLAHKQMWAWYFITPEKGVGKGVLWDIQTKLFGSYGKKVDVGVLTSQFNSWKFNALNLLIDEADDVNKKKDGINALNKLKQLITDNFDTVHKKGKDIDSYQHALYGQVEMHSNHISKLQIDDNERRFAVVYCKNKYLDSKVYTSLWDKAFPTISAADSIKDDSEQFYRKLTRFLLDYTPHKDYSVDRAPSTRWQAEVCEASRGKLDTILTDAITTNLNVFTAASALQTNQTLCEMLKLIHGYTKLTKNTLIEPLESLERRGVIRMVKKAYSSCPQIIGIDNGYHVDLIRRKNNSNPKVYAIRDFEEYDGKSQKIIREGFYPYITKEE